MKGESEWISDELRLPPILSGTTKPPRSSPIDFHSANKTHTGSRAQLLPDHSDRIGDGDGDGDGGIGGKSPGTSILPPRKLDQRPLSLSFHPHSPPGGPSNASQPHVVTHVQSGLSTAICTSKPRAKVKYRRIANAVSSVPRRDEV
jgi:hypothetical protein